MIILQNLEKKIMVFFPFENSLDIFVLGFEGAFIKNLSKFGVPCRLELFGEDLSYSQANSDFTFKKSIRLIR